MAMCSERIGNNMKRLNVIKEIKSLKCILPALLVLLTGNKRYEPEIKWSKKSWTHNIFRVYESIFWRRHGIRAEITTTYDGKNVIHQAHTFEGACALIETWIRNAFKFKLVKVWIPQFSSPMGLPVQNMAYRFAIAFDVAASAVGALSASPNTFSHTCTGSNLELVVGSCEGGVGADTAASYNSVSMTRQTIQVTTVFVTQFTLNAPASGAHTVSVTAAGTSGTVGFVLISTSFTGVKQAAASGEIGTTQTGASPSTGQTITTTGANSMIVDIEAVNGGGAVTNMTVSGTGQTRAITFKAGTSGTNDPGASVSYTTTTTTGNYTTSWTVTGGGATQKNNAIEILAVAASANGNFLAFL